jgi:NADH-quinone oxidoreductase subunit L
MKAGWPGVVGFMTHGLVSLPFWLAVAGIASAWYLYLVNPGMPARIAAKLGPIYTALQNNYYFDRFNELFFAGGSRKLGGLLSNVGDGVLIEGVVNGSARLVNWCSALLRQMQSGYVYHYAFTMIIGLFALLTWWVVR